MEKKLSQMRNTGIIFLSTKVATIDAGSPFLLTV